MPEDPEGHSYEAARAAEGARAALLAAGTEFIAETVFSHPSKVDLVRTAVDANYEVSLHVVMVPVEYCIVRIACRVEAGGDDVPEDKIRGRYDRLWRLAADASPFTRRTSFWDNTGRSPRLVGVSAADRWVRPAVWPTWVHPDLPALLGGIEATP